MCVGGGSNADHHLRPVGLDNVSRQAKLYNENSYLIESYSQEQLRRVILPFGTFRGLWDGLTLAFVMYTAVYMPYQLAFLLGDESTTTWDALRVLDLMQDFIFLIDIALNFQTGYIT